MKWAKIAVATLVAAPVAAAAVGSGLARHALDAGDADAALRWNPLFSDARTSKASKLLGAGDLPGSERLALEAIDRSPLNPDAAAILGYARGLHSGAEAATPFMAASTGMAWGNETAQLWMLGRAVASKRYEEAVVRTDALLRQRLHREELFPFLRGLTGSPAALPPIARSLARRPKWRMDYMQLLTALTPDAYEAHWALLEEMEKSSAPATTAEVSAYVSRLAEAELFYEARAAWIRFSGRKPDSEHVLDGNFGGLSGSGGNSPFEWTVEKLTGLSIGVQPSPGPSGGSALHITSDGRPSGPALTQTIVLPPGNYRLTMEAREGQADSLRSVGWRLVCVGGKGTAQVSAPIASAADRDWQRIGNAVQVPADCPAQRLELHVNHDSPRDLDLWLRSVRIATSGRLAPSL